MYSYFSLASSLCLSAAITSATNFDNAIGDNYDSNNPGDGFQQTSTLAASFWPNFRASLANRLVLETTIDPEYAYMQVYNAIPENGNCWCFSDRTLAGKGEPQDEYDGVCRQYHNCLHCGSFKDGDLEIINQGLDTEFTVDATWVGFFTPTENLPEFIYNDLFNYDGHRVSIYDWSCAGSNSVSGNAVCQCFKEFEKQFLQLMLQDILSSANSEDKIDFKYGTVCAHSSPVPGDGTDPDAGDCPDCPPEESESDPSGEEESPVGDDSPSAPSAASQLADACCGDNAPEWFLYYSDQGRKSCCGGTTYDNQAFDCCLDFSLSAKSLGGCGSGGNDTDGNEGDDQTDDDDNDDGSDGSDDDGSDESSESDNDDEDPLEAALNNFMTPEDCKSNCGVFNEMVPGIRALPQIFLQPEENQCDSNQDRCCDVDCGRYGSCNQDSGACSHCSGFAWGWGDTHYHSFDGYRTDFQGNCEYQLSGICDGLGQVSENTPYFKLLGRQQRKAGWSNPRVTFLHGWTMEWQPYQSDNVNSHPIITLKWDILENGMRVQIDKDGSGNFENLKAPHFYEDLQIQTTGMDASTIYFGIETEGQAQQPNNNFSAKLYYHWHRIYLHLECSYKNQVCGMMGTWDGDQSNDWTLPDLSVMPLPTRWHERWSKTFEFGAAWGTEMCAADQEFIDDDVSCSAEVTELIQSDEWCGRFLTAPFSNCNLNLKEMYLSCVYDLCLINRENWDETLCHLLEDQEQKCNDVGQHIGSWRSASLCPASCPANQSWQDHASGCVLTTDNCNDVADGSTVCLMSTQARCACNDSHPYWDSRNSACVSACPAPVEDPVGNCYVDAADRDLPHSTARIPAGIQSSVVWCQDECRKAGYIYAGVQYTHQCWCGNSYGKHGQSKASDCNKNCEDKERNKCGGGWRNNIYESGL